MVTDLSIILIPREETTDLSEVLSNIFSQKSATNYEVMLAKSNENEIKIPDQYKNYVKVFEEKTIPIALNSCLKNIQSNYFTFIYSTDEWNELLVSNVLTQIKQNFTDCIIYGVNLNKKFNSKNYNTIGLDFKNFNPKYQEEPFLVSETETVLFYLPELINNKFYRKEFFTDKNIFFENDRDYEQLFYYKFMLSDPKFMLLNKYYSRIIPSETKDVTGIFEKIEKYIEDTPFEDKHKKMLERGLITKKLIDWISYETPLKQYKAYNKKIKEKYKEILKSKKIYEYELKMNPFYVRIYKFMNSSFLGWYFWWNKHCIK